VHMAQRRVEINPLTVAEILDTPAGYDHAVEVRSIGPAVALVIEVEGPMRMEYLHSTEAEFRSLVAYLRDNPHARRVMDAFLEAKAEQEGTDDVLCWAREDEHIERLTNGQRLTNTRAVA
jgi:hypothetical protein